MVSDGADGKLDDADLRWLFLDLNSFFASAEQQMQPALRDRPVTVRPAPSEYTCAIAASYEARPFGVRTGMQVADARKLCPELIVVEARPDAYVDWHQRIMAEIDRHLPIWKVCSIDEAACRLTGPDRRVDVAVALARRVQAAILANVGECLRSSVGLAPSRFLAKTASGMQKPAGLTVLRADALLGPLLDLPLSKFPGIGGRMLARLAAAGVTDTAALWAMDPHHARRIWNSIEGERIWRGLHGLDSQEPPERPRASISHSHVLAASMRRPDQARVVARRLVVKCGARLRRMGLAGAGLSLFVDMKDGGARPANHNLSCPVPPTSDTFVLLRALETLWDTAMNGQAGRRITYVGVGVFNLKPLDAFAPDLFSHGPDEGGRARSLRLSKALDALNSRYGKDTVSIGPKSDLPAYVGAKIAFSRIPEVEEFHE